jgi:hypothetical protein
MKELLYFALVTEEPIIAFLAMVCTNDTLTFDAIHDFKSTLLSTYATPYLIVYVALISFTSSWQVSLA